MTDTLTNQDQITSYRDHLVGEGRKFSDDESMAKGKYESDVYIKTLERKLDQLTVDYHKEREENAAKAKLEELRDQILNHKLDNNSTQLNDASKKPEIDLSQIDSLITNKIKENDTVRRQNENLARVKAKLDERFGNHLDDHLKEIGLNGESAAQLAKTNPDLLLKALGADKAIEPGYVPPPRNSSGFTPKPAQKRTWMYYQELKKANPKLYWDPKINIQMQKDRIELGTAFEDGDYNAI